eukprot:m.1155661 g.1155661  ORF g.1155661 m.1155661 type:complete len:550 (+) comp24491_c0_seq9:140-1789(+)
MARKPCPADVAGISVPPPCETVDECGALSGSVELRKKGVDTLYSMQTELDKLSKASRARSMQLAEQYVALYKWKTSIWGKRKNSDKGSASSNKRKRENDAKKGDIKLVAVLGDNRDKSIKGDRSKKTAKGTGTDGDMDGTLAKSKKSKNGDDRLKSTGVLRVTGKNVEQEDSLSGTSATKRAARDRKKERTGRDKGDRSARRKDKGGAVVAINSDVDVTADGGVEIPQEDHPFWIDVETYFQDFSPEDVQYLKQLARETEPPPELKQMPERGRRFQDSWAEKRFVERIQLAASSSASDDQTQAPGPLALADYREGKTTAQEAHCGTVTATLLGMLIEDDVTTLESVGVGMPRPPQAHVKQGGVIVPCGTGMCGIEEGLQRTLGSLGLLETKPKVNTGRDEIADELRRLQRELKLQTAECSTHLQQLYENVTTSMDSKHKERGELERKLADVNTEIEKAYSRRQTTLRERKTQPKNVTEAITKLLNSREKLLQHPLLSPTGTAAAAAPESKKGMTSSSSNRSKSGGAGKAKSSNKASAVFDHPGTLSRKS